MTFFAMYNHFRTLLVNLPYAEDYSEHIPASFVSSIALPAALSNFYSLLFPSSTSRAQKLFLVDNYMKLIDATTYNGIVTLMDPRVTYGGVDSDYFQFRRVSIPTSSNASFRLQVVAASDLRLPSEMYSEVFCVRQDSNTDKVSVVSSLTGKVYVAEATLSFSSGTSNLVTIADTGLSFHVMGTDFTSSYNKIWSFSVDLPFRFDFPGLHSRLKDKTTIVEPMLRLYEAKTDVIFPNLWTQHPNSVYQFTGLVSAYVERVNVVCQTLVSQ